jgi:acetyl esterase
MTSSPVRSRPPPALRGDAMTLHPEIAKVLATLPAPPDGPLDPVAMRAAEDAMVPPVSERLPLHRVQDTVVATEAGDVPVRVYTPTASESYGVIVYLHGGAFFLGSLDTHDHVARALAGETGCKVVSVGYRLAPEHPFPAGLDDCYAVVRWVADNGDSLAWDRETLAIAGDSSGANYATVVAALARDDGLRAITPQVLYYPFNAFYLSSGADPDDPRVSPIKRGDLTGLPPALILTGELDPMRDEGEVYGERLKEAGVAATVTRYAGAGHGFVQHFAWLPEYHRAFTETQEFLQ